MTRENGFIHSFNDPRYGACTLEVYPSGEETRGATPVMLPFPNNSITAVDPLSGEHSHLPIGMNEIAELKVKVRLDRLPAEFRDWLNNPNTPVPGTFVDVPIVTRNMWILRADFKSGSELGTVLFVGVQQLENEIESKTKRGTIEKEITLLPFVIDVLSRRATDTILKILWAVTDYPLKEPEYGVDFRITNRNPHVEKTFSSAPLGYTANVVNWNLGYPKFFRVKDIFTVIASYLDFEFSLVTRGLAGFDFRCENPYKYIKWHKQTEIYDNELANGSLGAQLTEENLWFIAAYSTVAGRSVLSGVLYSGFFRRKGASDTKNMWDLVRYMAESLGLKGMVRADEIAFMPVFDRGYGSTVTPAPTDFKSDAEITEGYHVLRAVTLDKMDGAHSSDKQKYLAGGIATDGETWPLERMPLTNSPCSNQDGEYARAAEGSPRMYYINTPWPENRLYYFEDASDTLCYRVHDHCIIPASEENIDTSETHGAPYFERGAYVFPTHNSANSVVYSEFFSYIALLQSQSCLPSIVTRFLYTIFSKSNQSLLKAECLKSFRFSPDFVGQRFNIDPEIFAPDQLGEIGTTAFLMKSESKLNGEPGSVIKTEFFIRGT